MSNWVERYFLCKHLQNLIQLILKTTLKQPLKLFLVRIRYLIVLRHLSHLANLLHIRLLLEAFPLPMLYSKSIHMQWLGNKTTGIISKFGGKDISYYDLLAPELHCARCSFPELTTHILIGNMSYINKCTNTNVWIDHDLIIGFVTLLSHSAHSTAHSSSTPFGNNKALPQIIHVSVSKAQISIHGIKPFSTRCPSVGIPPSQL